MCGTKKVNRYQPPEVKAALAELEIAKERLQAACKRAWLDFLGDFGAYYVSFRNAVQGLACLDALQSLAITSCNPGCGVSGLHIFFGSARTSAIIWWRWHTG